MDQQLGGDREFKARDSRAPCTQTCVCECVCILFEDTHSRLLPVLGQTATTSPDNLLLECPMGTSNWALPRPETRIIPAKSIHFSSWGRI